MDYNDFDHDSSKFLKESISSSPLRQLTHLGLLGIKNYGPSVLIWETKCYTCVIRGGTGAYRVGRTRRPTSC